MDQRFFILFLGVVLIQIQSSFSIPLTNVTLNSTSNSTNNSTALEHQPEVVNLTQVKKARQDDSVNSTTLQLEKEHEEKVKAQSANLTQISNSIENTNTTFNSSTPLEPVSITTLPLNKTTTTTTTEIPIEVQFLPANETSENSTKPDNTTVIVETIELIGEIPLDTDAPIDFERANLESGSQSDNSEEREAFPSIFRDFVDRKDAHRFNLNPVDSIDFVPDDGGESVEVKSQVETLAFFYPKSKF